jgi:hypothetical protein
MRAIQIAARVLAVACLAAVAFVTLSPIGMRPVVAGLQTEHLAAFFAIGAMFGVGFPRHLIAAAIVVIAAAVGLEAMQNLVPGRHGRIVDMDVKIAGAVIGFICAAAWNGLASRVRADDDSAV